MRFVTKQLNIYVQIVRSKSLVQQDCTEKRQDRRQTEGHRGREREEGARNYCVQIAVQESVTNKDDIKYTPISLCIYMYIYMSVNIGKVHPYICMPV